MNHKYTSLITASALALTASSALGQIQRESPRHGVQIAERLLQERSGLYGAIAIAETHTQGVAIGVHLTGDEDLLTRQDPMTGQRQKLPADQRRAQSDPLFAIVTCVVDGTKVRNVIIDMATNTVIGVQTSTYNERDYSSDYNRDYDSSSGAGGYARASDLMNATVRNSADENLGDIDELAIDPDANRVVYGVLRRGGFIGLGESRYAISYSELSPPRNGSILLDLNESRFKEVEGFNNNNWPMQAEPKLRTSQQPKQATEFPTAKRIVKASDVIGVNVQSRDGHTLGKISDLVVEPRTGNVLYAILKTDRGHIPAPMAALKKSDKTYTLPMPMDQFRSVPTLDTNREPNWGDESWNRRIHESYGVRYETASARDSR